MNRSARVLALATPNAARGMAILGVQLLLLLALVRTAYPADSSLLLQPNHVALFGGSAAAPPASYRGAVLAEVARLITEARNKPLWSNLDVHAEFPNASAQRPRGHVAAYDGQDRELDGRVHYSGPTSAAAAGIEALQPLTDSNSANSKVIVLH